MNLKMGSLFWLMGLCFWVFVFSYSFSTVNADTAGGGANVEGTVFIDGKAHIGKIDNDFVCATLDWWPPEKCDYGTCSWGHASLLNLDLNNKILLNAIKDWVVLWQDKVIYDTEDHRLPCTHFVQNTSQLFGFTQGCLPLYRWDELNTFFKNSGPDGSAVGAWDSSNAESLIRYTVKKGYDISAWELGNELSGNGVGTRVAANQYASDTISLRNLVQDIYSGVEPKPQIIAPGGFFDQNWFKEFLDKTTNPWMFSFFIVGVDTHLIEKILDPSYLDGEANTFSRLQSTINSSASSATSWVGEAGGAYNSGRNLVTNAFVFSFWYLDQLGMASAYDTKTYCRQTLIGGNYGLLNTNTFVPNPDYYSALLWHRLMGRNVLSTSFSGPKKIRAYAHCAKQSVTRITLLLINLDNSTTVEAKVAFNGTSTLQHKHKLHRLHRLHKYRHRHRIHRTKVIWFEGSKTSEMEREEYHLTAKDGNLHSQTMLLNGNILTVNASGDIPPLEPLNVNSSSPITIAPFSIVFVHMPSVVLPACR
ncbi:Heparanase-like protein 3 [Vitis vinifera]|uniref:Heparanase-like protein 3 n=1 Tax=Vitis vinifera TaxID=29760 RepID=A0A438E851_VITVI|nr:Heparanase-like protein 3 [Vitis vinifera]